MGVVMHELLDALIIMLAALTGGAVGCLLTIGRYHWVAHQRAAHEEELVQSQDVLAAMALLRRVETRRNCGPHHPEE